MLIGGGSNGLMAFGFETSRLSRNAMSKSMSRLPLMKGFLKVGIPSPYTALMTLKGLKAS